LNKIRKAIDPLLTRDEFREAVFTRDNHRCVICGDKGQDAHHILERRLFNDGGYYVSNGATLCGTCHIEAEQTVLTVEEIRRAANILAPAIPSHFYPEEQYDKWGNIIVGKNRRTKGELFFDTSVQKILDAGGVLGEFSDYVKYPRTLHLPWSKGATQDDRIHTDLSGFIGKEVIASRKMDGECTSLYTDNYHARSLDGNSHPSQSWARNFHSKIAHNIPKGWRICCENLYAKHSIAYDSLPSYLLVHSIWNEQNVCLEWDSTVEWAKLLDMQTVPVLYRGLWDEKRIRALHDEKLDNQHEGYVVRIASAFSYADFRKVVGKYVRAGHVQSGQHWKHQRIIPNQISK
jgi:hypothetical protein